MKIRRESPRFAPWDADGMARHLEEMARKGWLFRGIDWLGRWEFAPAEPQQLRFAVAYAPSRSNWRLTPTEAERDLEDICFDTGWRKVAALSRFHIYRSDDPNAPELETDEAVRLDTLHRSLGPAALISALVRTILALGLIALLIRAMADQLPRALSIPMLPFCFLFALWLIWSEVVPLILYRLWLRKARGAAAAGLPCPPVRGWGAFSRINSFVSLFLLGCMLLGGNLPILLIYAGVLLVFHALRFFLEQRMYDADLAEDLWRVLLVAAFVVIFALNRWYAAPDTDDPRTDAIPLMAQHFRNTDDMELSQFLLDDLESGLASYHRYWQADSRSSYDLQYTVFDLRVPMLEASCDIWFREQFDAIALRGGLTVSPADSAMWDAEAVLYAGADTGDHWLIFYNGRTVLLFTSWNMTEAEVAAAAARLAP